MEHLAEHLEEQQVEQRRVQIAVMEKGQSGPIGTSEPAKSPGVFLTALDQPLVLPEGQSSPVGTGELAQSPGVFLSAKDQKVVLLEGQSSMVGTVEPAQSIGAFLAVLDREIALPKEQSAAIRNDFFRGMDALSAQGMPMREILFRLHPGRLRGFYAQTGQGFYPLDNGAKQYPISMVKGRMAMFRLTATLDAPVQPALLQLALTFSLRRFPHYATRLRRGAFWYYLKPCPARYGVQQDTGAVCAPIDVANTAQALFRVLYRGNTVSVELFHVLSDGMGGMMFLQTLLAEYYRLQGEDGAGEDGQALDTAAPSLPEDVENGFSRFRGRGRGETLLGAPAVQLPARLLPPGECRVDRYAVSAAKLREAAHAHGVSVTALMSAVILTACRKTAQASKGSYRLQVTVDLRRVFPSRTLRNFSWFGALRSDAANKLEPLELAEDLHRQLKALADRKALEDSISAAQRVIRWFRYVPLQWKVMLLRTAYRMTGDYFFTATLSNLGVIALHGPLATHVREVAAVLGPSPSNPYSFALATVHDSAVLCVTRATDDLTMRRRLAESALLYGIPLTKKG